MGDVKEPPVWWKQVLFTAWAELRRANKGLRRQARKIKLLSEQLTTLQAEKERLERNECPHCDGGEVYVGSSFPDDEGFATCETCEGSALLPNADDIRIMRNKLREMQGDLQAYEQGQIPAYQDRIKELEGELGRLREQKVTPLNEHTRLILGRPNFALSPFAHRLRALGHDIPCKSEDEQAHVIHLMLNLYEKHGKNWRDEFSKYLQHPTQEPTNGS